MVFQSLEKVGETSLGSRQTYGGLRLKIVVGLSVEEAPRGVRGLRTSPLFENKGS